MAPTWVPGAEGFALSMRSGYVAIADTPAIRPEKAITVELWVKLARVGGDLVCENSVYMMRLGGGGVNWLVGVDGRWCTLHGQHSVPTDRWTHLALTYDSATRTAAAYIDGALDVKQEVPGKTPGLLSQGKAELRLGLNDWNPLGSEVDGKVAALRISNVARTFRAAFHLGAEGDLERQSGAQRRLRVGPVGLAAGRRGRHDFALGHRRCQRRQRSPVPAHPSGQREGNRSAQQRVAMRLVSRPVQANPGARYVFSARCGPTPPGGRRRFPPSPPAAAAMAAVSRSGRA